MFKRRKCQAADPSKCVDPNCPEQMFLKNAFAQAIKLGDYNAYVEAKEQEKRLTPSMVIPARIATDWDTLYVKDSETGNVYQSSVRPPEKATYTQDTGIIKSYDSYKAIEQELRGDSNIFIRLMDNHGPYNEQSLQGFSLSDFYVSPKLRGQGAGTHLMKTITKHADDNELVIELVPTNAGDGRIKEGQEGWAEAALAHRTRLIKFYESHGFQRNPFYSYADKKDYLTKEPYTVDVEAQAMFTDKAKKVLRDHSMYIRYPNGKYPKGWRKKPAVKSVS